MKSYLTNTERMKIRDRAMIYRASHDLTREDLGKLVGVSKRAICSFENGEWGDISDTRIQKIGEAIASPVRCKTVAVMSPSPPVADISDVHKGGVA